MSTHFEDYIEHKLSNFDGIPDRWEIDEMIADYMENECSKEDAIDFAFTWAAEVDSESFAYGLSHAIRDENYTEDFATWFLSSVRERLRDIVREKIKVMNDTMAVYDSAECASAIIDRQERAG